MKILKLIISWFFIIFGVIFLLVLISDFSFTGLFIALIFLAIGLKLNDSICSDIINFKEKMFSSNIIKSTETIEINTVNNSNITLKEIVKSEIIIEMKRCPFCAEEILIDAVKCKHCGSDIKKTDPKKPTFLDKHPIISIIIGLIFIIPIFQSINESTEKYETSSNPIDNQFSAYDGKHIHLTNFLKQNLKDPDSFEHISTTRVQTIDSGGKDYLIVNMKYRAKNGFGGYNISSIKAFYDLEGNPIKTDKWENY